MSKTLYPQQQAAFNSFFDFIADRDAQTFVIEGYAGTGKSTLVKHLLDELPKLVEAWRTIDPSYPDYEISLTSTTHKAVENLKQISSQDACTIHSFLGLRLSTDYKTGATSLYPGKNFSPPIEHIVVVDEAGQMTKEMIEHLFNRTKRCKFLLMGDPAQLVDFKTNTAPVFNAGYPTAKLTDVIRNGGQILELATACRNWVNTGVAPSITPSGTDIVWMDQDDFNAEIAKEFSRSDWKPSDSSFLAYTNARVIEYNNFIRGVAKGDPDFQVGDDANVNEYYVDKTTGKNFKTDQSVVITAIEPGEENGLVGKYYTIDGTKAFKPDSLKEWRKAISTARANGEYQLANQMQESWIDLRAIYARTVHKAQGSTFKRVFVDLSDLGKCRQVTQLARLAYVAFSRPTDQIVMTGDFV